MNNNLEKKESLVLVVNKDNRFDTLNVLKALHNDPTAEFKRNIVVRILRKGIHSSNIDTIIYFLRQYGIKYNYQKKQKDTLEKIISESYTSIIIPEDFGDGTTSDTRLQITHIEQGKNAWVQRVTYERLKKVISDIEENEEEEDEKKEEESPLNKDYENLITKGAACTLEPLITSPSTS